MTEKLVQIASFSTPMEAHIVRARIESAGIPAYIQDEHTVTANWFYSNAIGGVKVFVGEADVEAARAVLTEPIEQADVPAEQTAGWGLCPKCAGADVSFRPDNAPMWLSFILLGFPLLFPKKRLCCKTCNHQWPMKEPVQE